MNLIRYGFTAGMILFCSTMLSAKEITRHLNYRICVPDQASRLELMAANELASYLKKSYTEKISLNNSTSPILFSVGFAPEAKEFTKSKDAFKESGFGVFCRNRQILLTGLDDPDVRPCHGYEEGTLLSVYYFLRRYTGLKVYAPDPVHGEKITRNMKLELPAADKPVFSFSLRDMSRYFTDVSAAETALYSRKQLSHNPRWANTNVYYIVLNKWGKRFKDQKELLGLYQGKRKSVIYPHHLPCLTNPKVKEIIVSDVLAMIRKSKAKHHVLRIFCDAPFKRCECANCARVANNNEYFYGFILSVWNEVKKQFPETRLFLQEKGKSHYAPPSKGDLKGVVVDISTGFPSKGDYRKLRPLFQQWKDRGALPTLRLYPRYPKWGNCPIINPHDIIANFRAMKGVCLGQRRSDGMSSPHAKRNRIPYAFAALTNFVHASGLLNADADPDQLIREFCTFMYPGAAEEMIEFYSWMEKRTANLGAWEDPRMNCYPYEALAYPESLLEKAAKKCTKPFWLNKLRTAFKAFREETRQLCHLTKFRKQNQLEMEQKKASFRKKYAKPFYFSARKTAFELCPLSIPFATKIQDSTVQVQVKGGRLVFRLTAMEDQIQWIQKRATKEKPDSIWQDETFEIMLAPDKKDVPYYHFAVNPNGAVVSYIHTKSKLRKLEKLPGNWKSSAAVGSDRWTVEFSVPEALLRKICPDGKGRIGIYRTRLLSRMKQDERDYFFARSSLDAHSREVKNYHNLSTYHPFILQGK